VKRASLIGMPHVAQSRISSFSFIRVPLEGSTLILHKYFSRAESLRWFERNFFDLNQELRSVFRY
jgi:hypothetical protein